MSTNKSTSLSVYNIPCFNGKNFQGWSEKMISVFMIAKVYGIITRDTVKPADNQRPQEPSPPDAITAETDNATVTWLNTLWIQYNVQLVSYNQQMNIYERKMSSWNDSNSQATGIFNRALDIGIWDQVKAKTTKETWDWLKERYTKSSHLEIMEHFQFLKDQKIDLSDQGLYPPPRNPYGLQWTPVDSSGFQWPSCQARLAGAMSSPVHWTHTGLQATFQSPVPVQWSPVESSVFLIISYKYYKKSKIRRLTFTL